MSGDLSVDLGAAIPYAVDRLLALFGKDSLTQSARARLSRREKSNVDDSTHVQCIGMSQPIPLENIYQPTRLQRQGLHGYGPEALLTHKNNAIVWGAPGAGKSVLMRVLFRKLLQQTECIPLLFALRTPDSVSDLHDLVEDLKLLGPRVSDRKPLVLLVDGYDEIDVDNRRLVSKILTDVAALGFGRFVVTCRTHYDVVDLRGDHFHIGAFDTVEARRFITAFFLAYGSTFDTESLLIELKERRFSDFLSSPLMLTLVCILKTGPNPDLPKNTLALIRRAIDTLTFRWDESRGISRRSSIKLDGEERVRCLMAIAIEFPAPLGPESVAVRVAEEYLYRNHYRNVSATKFLLEVSQWYGIFNPVSAGQWEFSHRTIHDFLAARQWVETGEFARLDMNAVPVSARAAYAACLVKDATPYMVNALERTSSLQMFAECLSGGASFDSKGVARALVIHFRSGAGRGTIRFIPGKDESVTQITEDFLYTAPDDFVDYIFVDAARNPKNGGHEALFSLAASEIYRRGRRVDLQIRNELVVKTYFVRRGTLGDFRFNIARHIIQAPARNTGPRQ